MAASKKSNGVVPKKRSPRKDVEGSVSEVTKPVRRKLTKKNVSEVDLNNQEVVFAPPLKIPKKVKEEVSLPKNISLRTKSKAKALSEVLDSLEKPFFVIAYVSAACFVLVGISMLLSSSIKGGGEQLAQLLTSTTTTNILNPDGENSSGSGSGGTTNTTGTLLSSPVFELLEQLPSTITSETRIIVSVTNASKITALAYSKSTTKSYELAVERVSNTSFRITINPANFPSGEYVLRIQAVTETLTGVYSFTVGTFSKPAEVVPTTDTSNDEPDSGDEAETDTTQTDSSVEKLTDDVVSTTTEPTEEVVPISILPTQFSIDAPTSLISDYKAIRIYAPDNYSSIEVYVRPPLSTQARFVGTAYKNDSRWIFAFNSNNVPNGTYQMYAVANYQGQKITSRSVSISILNKKVEEPIVIDRTVITEPETATDEGEVEEQPTNRTFYTYETETNFVPVAKEAESAEIETTTLLELHQDTVDELLKNFALTTQSNNEFLKYAVEKDFDSIKEEIRKGLLDDPEKRQYADQVDDVLEARFGELKERVIAFEDLRSSRTSSDVESDSDKDGITDFDESEIYHTDPNNPDTDNDGFLDGVEIVKGFNPKDAAREAVVEFELPQTTIGLERTDILKVKSVKPLIETDESLEKPVVQTEISGQGLPNSFVTLYIFSTPTIVTIKTDADGSFTYTFDKELEDGEHEVYVAFTDNTGSVMAHSEPFRFVKEAEAFTPVGAKEDEMVTAASLTENSLTNQTNTVIGLGILAFGIILLMLGMSIRPNKTVSEQVVN